MHEVTDEVLHENTDYGLIILTTSVIAIIITAPIGVILVNTYGFKWLTYDGPKGKDTWGKDTLSEKTEDKTKV